MADIIYSWCGKKMGEKKTVDGVNTNTICKKYLKGAMEELKRREEAPPSPEEEKKKQ